MFQTVGTIGFFRERKGVGGGAVRLLVPSGSPTGYALAMTRVVVSLSPFYLQNSPLGFPERLGLRVDAGWFSLRKN